MPRLAAQQDPGSWDDFLVGAMLLSPQHHQRGNEPPRETVSPITGRLTSALDFLAHGGGQDGRSRALTPRNVLVVPAGLEETRCRHHVLDKVY